MKRGESEKINWPPTIQKQDLAQIYKKLYFTHEFPQTNAAILRKRDLIHTCIYTCMYSEPVETTLNPHVYHSAQDENITIHARCMQRCTRIHVWK